MKVLVVGNRGFIGAHVYHYFMDRFGDEVWGCDVVTDYSARNYFLIDAVNADFDELFRQRKFDVCINCSGASSVPESMTHPRRDYYLNTKYVFDILEAIRKYSPDCKFLNMSSAAVYGNPKKLPINENDPLEPLSPYGWHKHQSEIIIKEYYEVYGTMGASVRIFSAYGVGLKKQLFWDWHSKLQRSTHITLFGTGNESRDFIYVSDIATALDYVIQQSDFTADIVNVANGKEIFIKDAIEIFRDECKFNFTYEFTNSVRKGDPLNWRADISRLAAFGYTQKVEFREGLRKYLTWLSEKK